MIAVDRDAAALERLAGELEVVAIAGDVTEVAVLERAAEAARTRGGLAAWINNAAVQTEGRFDLESDERIERTLDVNLRAPLLGCRTAIRAFLAQGRAGAIVNVSSIHAHGTLPGWVTYAAAKGGIEALTRGICVEYGQLGIRCNAVAPGAVLTDATSAVLAQAPDPDAVLAGWRALAPMDVVLEPADVAAGVAFLLSAEARYLNGHVLRIDAGMAAAGASAPPLPQLLPPIGTQIEESTCRTS